MYSSKIKDTELLYLVIRDGDRSQYYRCITQVLCREMISGQGISKLISRVWNNLKVLVAHCIVEVICLYSHWVHIGSSRNIIVALCGTHSSQEGMIRIAQVKSLNCLRMS